MGLVIVIIDCYVVLVLFLVKCYDNEMAKSPFSLINHPLIEPQVANHQQKKIAVG